jgi:ureidoglycolate lyase
MRTVQAIPLTAEGFAPYGHVIEAKLAGDVSANAGTARRFNHVAEVVNNR